MREVTLSEARAKLRADRTVDAVVCPCCDQLAKLYRRTITSTMARWLIELVRRHAKEPRPYSVQETWALDILKGTGDVAKLRYWGLISHVPKGPEDGHKRTSGYWLPTQRGIDFVHDRIRVHRRVLVYDAQAEGFEGADGPETWSIRNALGRHFDYRNLMDNEP